MKTVKKLGVSGSLLSAVKNAEASLARQESRDLEHGLPEGHPLHEEVEKQKAALGDLSGLPPGHPLLISMQAAKERFDHQQSQKDKEQKKTAEVRKAQDVAADRIKKASRRAEEEQNEQLVGVAKQINGGIDGTLSEVRRLYKVMADNEEILNIDHVSRAKAGRLKRLLFAVERGISECRIVKARA